MKFSLFLHFFIGVFLLSQTNAGAQKDTLSLANNPVSVKGSTGLSVKPAKIDFNLSKGEAAYQVIYITNEFNRTMQFKATVLDWMRDSTGAHIYADPGTFGRSCARWISFNKDVIEVEPGKTGELLVRLVVPDSASAVSEMKWCLVMLESVTENKKLKPSDSSRAVVNMTMRLGIHILQTPQAFMTDKNIEMVSFTADKADPHNFKILCRNTGKTQLQCLTFLEVTSLQTGEKIKLDPKKFPIFPDQKRYINFTLPNTLAKGKYTVTAVVDAGDDDVPLLASEAVIDLK